MSYIEKFVRLPLYDGYGKPLGEEVEIPLIMLRNALHPVRVFELDIRIRKVPDIREKPDFTGPGYEAHPGHDHEDCCK